MIPWVTRNGGFTTLDIRNPNLGFIDGYSFVMRYSLFVGDCSVVVNGAVGIHTESAKWLLQPDSGSKCKRIT
jgi:hypothetical protein